MVNLADPANVVGGRGRQVRDLAEALIGRGHVVETLDVRRRRWAANVVGWDVVHAHGGASNVAVLPGLLSQRRPSRAVATLHGWHRRDLLDMVENLAERLTAGWFDALAVPSHEMVERLPPRLRKRTVVVPNGVRRVPTSRHDGVGLSVLWMGRVAAEKRPDLALWAWERARQAVPDLRLQMVGPLEEKPMRALLDSATGRSGFRYWGQLDDPWGKVPADLFLHTAAYEGLPRVVLEAMCARVPVVATAVGGVPDAIEHEQTGLLCPPGMVGPLADALVRLATDDIFRTQITSAAWQRYDDEFTIERMAARVEELYEGFRDF